MQFVRVKLAPALLQKGEFVIGAPTFRDEIDACKNKKPKSNLATLNYLREVIATVGFKYIGPTFNPLTDVNVSHSKGLNCETADQMHEIVLGLFRQHYPKMFDAYVEYHIKNRPMGVNLIYFLGDNAQAGVFIRMGFHEVLEKDLQPKKKVGKPAITNEEIARNSETVV